jgi:DNA/RNA endonuclease G (NUC1)
MTYIKTFLIGFFITISLFIQAQSVRIDSTKFTINHGDLTFYLDNDTASFVSVHKVTYQQVIKLDGKRSEKWHKEKPFGPYNREAYQRSGYDLGHLSPSNITSYNDSLNYHSFSLFNQAPQLAKFNRGNWKSLEASVEDSILKYKSNATIITGVIYDATCKPLPNSKITIPSSYFKVLYIGKKVYCWIGSNTTCEVKPIKLVELNAIFEKNKMGLTII